MSYAFYRADERSSSINYDFPNAVKSADPVHQYSSLDNPEIVHSDDNAPKMVNVCGWQTNRCRFALAVLALLTVTGFLLGHFVIVPAILKGVVSNAELHFSVIDISNPDNSSFTLTSSGFIDTKTSLAAQMAALPTELYYDGHLLGRITMPALRVKGVTEFQLSDRVQVLDLDAFARFTHAVLFDAQVPWQLKATATVTPQLGSMSLLTYHNVPFEKTITLTGCSGLTNVHVDSFLMNASTPTEVIADAQVTLMNPSVFTITGLGRLRLQAMFEGSYMSTLVSEPTSLIAGANVVFLRGVITPANKTASDILIDRYLTAQDTELVGVAGPDVTEFPLLSAGMQGLQMPVLLEGKDLNLIQTIEFQAMNMTPVGATTVQLDAPALLTVTNPLGEHAALNISWAEFTVDVSFEDRVIATMTTPQLPVIPLTEDEFQRMRNGDQVTPAAAARVSSPASSSSSSSSELSSILTKTSVSFAGIQLASHHRFARRLSLAAALKSTQKADPTTPTPDPAANLATLHFLIPVSSTLDLSGNEEAFDLFTRAFVDSVNPIQLSMTGRANLLSSFSLGYVPVTNMAVHNTVEVHTMEGLQQVSILSVDVPADSPIAGVEVVSGVRMHNPSVASVQMGNVVLGLSIDVNPSASASASPVTLSLGEMTVPDLTLHPGDNEVTSTGYLFPTIVQASPVPVFSSSSSTLQLRTPADPVALTYAGPFFSRYLANITQPVRVRGIRAENPTTASVADVPAWLQAAVSAIDVEVNFPGSPIPPIGALALQRLELKFVDDMPYASATVLAKLQIPWRCPFAITGVTTLNFRLASLGQDIVSVSATGTDLIVQHDQVHQVLTLHNVMLPLRVLNADLFTAFVQQTLTSSQVLVGVVGAAAPVVQTSMGVLQLTDVATQGQVQVLGFNNFLGKLSVLKIDVVDGIEHALTMSVLIQIDNPTNVLVSAGSLTLDMYTPDGSARIGNASIADFSITGATIPPPPFGQTQQLSDPSSLTNLSAISVVLTTDDMTPTSPVIMFLATFLNGRSQNMLMRGNPQSSSVLWMVPAMSGFSTMTVVPGLAHCLVSAFKVKLAWSEVFGAKFPTAGTIVNPFNIEWAIIKTDCNVSTVEGVTIGYWRVDYTNSPIVVPPAGTVTTDYLDVEITKKFDWTFLDTVRNALMNDAAMSVSGELTVRIGRSFVMTMNWDAEKVPTSLVLS